MDLSQKQINYIFSAAVIILGLVLGYFGITLPTQPEIPEPLQSGNVATYDDLDALRNQVEAMQAAGDITSFSVSSDGTYSTACYRKQGGSEWVADDGCEWGVLDGATLEIQSGGTLDVQSGAAITLSGYVTSTLDSLTVNGAAEVTSTLTAQDVVVTDTLSVGGASDLTGNVTITGTTDAKGNISDSGGDLTLADDTVITGTLDVQGGDITMENDETLSNSTDGVVQIGGFTALSEGAVVEATAAGTITPLASFQPITSSAAITDAVIADGSVAGQLLVITNENAADDITILESGSNLVAGGDITLTGGAYDAVTLLWDGTQWVRLSFEDN